MPARLFNAILAALASAAPGFALGLYVGGPGAARLIALIAGVVAAALAFLARDRRQAALRAVTSSGSLIAIHAAALYTFADAGHTPLLSANAQLLLAVPAMAALAAAWGRLRRPAMTRERHTVDDDDATLELPVSPSMPATLEPAAPAVAPAAATATATVETPRWRTPLALGVVASALFVVATMFWLEDDPPHAALASAVARELPSQAREPAPAMPPAGETAQLPDADVTAAPPAPPAPAPTASDNAMAPSAARRECMAQIESARLFLQLARQASDHDGYAAAISGQMDRMLKSRPVGPRTLSRIADRMWETRGAPDREPAWWSSQYRRCEEARTAGSWYVVRG